MYVYIHISAFEIFLEAPREKERPDTKRELKIKEQICTVLVGHRIDILTE